MYRKILAPLDGSETAECALAHVQAIATGCGVPEVQLLYVAEPIPPGLYQSVAEGTAKRAAWGRDYLAGVKKRLAAEGMNVSGVMLEGKAAEAIVDYASSNGVDLIVMSTHGRSGPSRWAFGSVADRVVRMSPVPVLMAVPRGCRAEPH